jgi:NAD(P)-dependent dehydrogenase (short-subunit alcohol dehydrogenase family)
LVVIAADRECRSENVRLQGHGLDGKLAIVSGGGTRGPGVGNGRAIAILLAEAGAHVAVVDKDLDAALGTKQMIEDEGGVAVALEGNVSNPGDCERVVAHSMRDFDVAPSVLVNNVGISGPPDNVVDVDLGEWESTIRTNLTSMMLMSKYTIPHMAGGGSIVNMASIAGMAGGADRTAYAASKAAVINLTRVMAYHHGPAGIRVNAIAPGRVFTPMVYELSPEVREARRLSAPLHLEGTPWDVAAATVFLAGQMSRWISGVLLPVDGGVMAVYAGAGLAPFLPAQA